MTINKPQHGGARTGAGRPPADNPAKMRSFRMNDEQWQIFQERGGIKWLKSLLKK